MRPWMTIGETSRRSGWSPRMLRYLEQVLEWVLGRLASEGPTEHLSYFVQLAAFHEEMHCEAFAYTRQTLGYSAPGPGGSGAAMTAGAHPGDVEVTGGDFRLPLSSAAS